MSNGELLSRTESSALRGIAILGIILHNYCHFLGFAVKENEYKFDAGRPMQFLDKLFSLNSDLFIQFFSFLGHYGVPIFLFISGYGLVKNHAFLDGNKRVGAHAMLVFLALNGIELVYTQKELSDVVLAVASGDRAGPATRRFAEFAAEWVAKNG